MDDLSRFAFIALVTCYLLARILGGGATALETVVYGATAAVGLEFVMSSWPSLLRARRQQY